MKFFILIIALTLSTASVFAESHDNDAALGTDPNATTNLPDEPPQAAVTPTPESACEDCKDRNKPNVALLDPTNPPPGTGKVKVNPTVKPTDK